jgi:hypothetical protein
VGLVFAGLWVGSAVAGWLHFWIWLVIPPLVAIWIAMGKIGRGIRSLKKIGADGQMQDEFAGNLFLPMIKFSLAQLAIHVTIFLLFFGLSALVSRI